MHGIRLNAFQLQQMVAALNKQKQDCQHQQPCFCLKGIYLFVGFDQAVTSITTLVNNARTICISIFEDEEVMAQHIHL